MSFNPSSSTSQSVSPGYYSGGTLSSSSAYSKGYSDGRSSAPTISYSDKVITSNGVYALNQGIASLTVDVPTAQVELISSLHLYDDTSTERGCTGTVTDILSKTLPAGKQYLIVYSYHKDGYRMTVTTSDNLMQLSSSDLSLDSYGRIGAADGHISFVCDARSSSQIVTISNKFNDSNGNYRNKNKFVIFSL